MAIRFRKALQELHIRLESAVEYLQERKELGEVQPDLNFKLNDKQFTALVEKFWLSSEVRRKLDLKDDHTDKMSQRKNVNISISNNLYVIDTNVFFNCPGIIERISENNKIVISAKVIDELDGLKGKLIEEIYPAQIALRNINKALSNGRISVETADTGLLPDDLNPKSPDNKILSVALRHKTENPILLTSDIGLQVKAKGLGINALSLENLLEGSCGI